MFTGLLGPNGAGKTTALRILYTVLQQDRGSAWVDGFDTLEAPPAARPTALLSSRAFRSERAASPTPRLARGSFTA